MRRGLILICFTFLCSCACPQVSNAKVEALTFAHFTTPGADSAEGQELRSQSAIRSSRLTTLEAQLKAGDATALDRFWREVKQEGTPLIERIPGDDKYVFVTFLWRGKADTKNIVLFSESLPGNCGSWANSREELLRSRLVNLSGSNVFFRTCKLLREGRFTYYLSVNDPMLLRWERKDWNSLQPDSFNPRRLIFHLEKGTWVSSSVELPGADHASWAEERSGVPKGRTEEFRLNSNSLGEERRFWIYTPPGYSPTTKRYRLLVLFDGWGFTHIVPTPTILDNLLFAQRIPPIVVVFVDQKKRVVELGCSSTFNDFLVRELMPWIRARYAVSSDAAETVIGGQSLGGLAAAYAGLKHPEVFGTVLSLFGAFFWEPGGHLHTGSDAEGDLGEWEWIIHQYAQEAQRRVRFTMIAGLFDYGDELSPRPSMLTSNRHMRDVLIAKGYPVVYREIAAGDEMFASLFALPIGLQLALGGSASQP